MWDASVLSGLYGGLWKVPERRHSLSQCSAEKANVKHM